MKIYIIWGIEPGNTSETPLVENFEGKDITDPKLADWIATTLEQKHNCTQTRVQAIDLKDNNLSIPINL